MSHMNEIPASENKKHISIGEAVNIIGKWIYRTLTDNRGRVSFRFDTIDIETTAFAGELLKMGRHNSNKYITNDYISLSTSEIIEITYVTVENYSTVNFSEGVFSAV